MVNTRQSRTKASELERLRARLAEAEDTLRAIRRGDVDAIVVDGPQGKRIFTLQSADDPYRILVERMNEGAATLNGEGTILFCNRRLAEMIGLPSERLVGSSFRSALCEKEWQGFTELAHRALTNNVRGTSELLSNDGTMLPVQLSLSPLPGQDWGQSICLIATDLSEQRQAEMRLREQAALIDLSPDAIVVRDMQNRIKFWNRGAEAMYGWPSADALGRDSTKLLKTEFFESTETVRAELLRQGHWEGDAIQYRRDGTRLIVASRSALQRDQEGVPVGILTTNNDVTAHWQAETKQASLTERLSLATAVAKVGVWEWDLASNMLAWDATMYEIYGLKVETPITYEQWTAMVPAEDLLQTEATLQKAIEEQSEGTLEFRIIRQDGSVRNISAVYRVLLDERTKHRRAVGVNLDVTERKDAEKALEQTRKDQLQFKDELLSHVSHELRTPLTAIKQFSTILLDGLAGELNRDQHQYQHIVLKNILQLQSMIDDLLEVTRLENGKIAIQPESTSVSEAVADVINTIHGSARAKGVTLSCDLSPGLPAAHADPTRLRQILLILLDNALQFTPSGGALKIRARSSEQDAAFVVLEVSDTGCGIPSEDVTRIFDRLYQVNGTPRPSRAGLGLGLFICHGLVIRQGGQIWVESKLNEGSTFSFTLPVFSVDSLIAPLLVNDKWPMESVALVVVDVWPRELRPSTEAGEYCCQLARSRVQSCLMPNLDVLLQQTRIEGERQRFFVAAFADKKGISVLTNRIRGQLGLPPLLQETEFSISHTLLHPSPLEPHASAKDAVNRMAAHLQAAIKSQMLSEISNCE
jgi:PAS domain S-box-containing protein